MTHKSFAKVLQGLEPCGTSRWSAKIADNWVQGRTTYGGLSTALCLQAVINEYTSLPALRSAQVSFISPVGDTVEIQTSKLKQGKSVTFIRADLFSNEKLALSVTFVFGQPRQSQLNRTYIEQPVIDPPESCQQSFDSSMAPAFTQNFDAVTARGDFLFSGSSGSDVVLWCRHRDHHITDTVALLGLADLLPPAILQQFESIAPISSMVWSVNLLSDDYSNDAAWWILRSKGEYAHSGYSSQTMEIWNDQGKLIATGNQNIAIFY